MGVCQMVQNDHQGLFPLGLGISQYILQALVRKGCHECRYALMALALRDGIQLGTVYGLHQDSPFPGFIHDVTKDMILKAIWGPAHIDDSQYLRVYIRQLRAKLGDDDDPRWIFTEPGVGYRLADR